MSNTKTVNEMVDAAAKRHHFPCQHEGGTGAFYPLTLDELRALLTTAATSTDWFERNSIQIRLVQGIRGITCPYPASGDVSRRMNEVDTLYVETLRNAPRELPGMAERFYALLEPGKAKSA